MRTAVCKKATLHVRDPRTIFELDSLALAEQPISTGAHCFACTAGAGSSCGGSLV